MVTNDDISDIDRASTSKLGPYRRGQWMLLLESGRWIGAAENTNQSGKKSFALCQNNLDPEAGREPNAFAEPRRNIVVDWGKPFGPVVVGSTGYTNRLH